MVINLNKPKELISKMALMTYLTEVEVFNKYLDNPEGVVLGKAILSPLRKENNPSFGFFQGQSGEICFKDHLLGGGDCIRFVQMKYGLTYFEALSKIAIDFNLGDDYICKKFEKENFESNTNQPTKEQLLSKVTSLKLGKNKRRWQDHDKEFWQSFGITLNTLERFRVEPISYIYINDKIFKADKYAYCFIENKDGKETYKIYQPFNKYYKWINNNDDSTWQGWEQLPSKDEVLIFTKSLKDVMALWDVAKIPAVSLQSENVIPKRHVFEILNERFKDCYSLYDNDFDKEINYGKKFGEKISREFGLIEIYIPDEYKSKDFSDLVKNVGSNEAKRILFEEMFIPF
jgi:hypothetical protein